MIPRSLSLSRGQVVWAFCASTLVLLMASVAVASSACEAEVEIRLAAPSAAARSAGIGRDHYGVRAVWLSAREVVLQPTRPALSIAGSAGLEVTMSQSCFLDLPDGYFPALHLRTSARDIEALGFGLCDPADGICYWREIARPVR